MEDLELSKWFGQIKHVIKSDDAETHHLEWGTLKHLSEKSIDPLICRVASAFFLPGKKQPLHEHPQEDEVIYIISGSAEYYFDGNKHHISFGDLIYIPSGTKHYTFNNSLEPLRYISIKIPIK